jgi:hypothetical protein
MTPLDDELRSMFTSRADAVAPAADPLGGIERRAKRMRRNKVGASIAGAVLAVAAIAIAVPSLVPDDNGAIEQPANPSVTAQPSPEATNSVGPNEPGPTPDVAQTSGPGPTARPDNYLEWQTRGTVDARTESQAVSAFAQAKGTTDDQVGHHVLWGGTDKSGRNLVFMEAWVGTTGGTAQTFGFVSTGEPFLGPALGKSPDVLAYLASGAPGTGTDVLVLLPRLGAGPFSYATSATAPYRQVGNARSDLENVAVVYRDPKASSDKLKVLDGDGMKVLYDGAVQPLLCGASGCG